MVMRQGTVTEESAGVLPLTQLFTIMIDLNLRTVSHGPRSNLEAVEPQIEALYVDSGCGIMTCTSQAALSRNPSILLVVRANPDIIRSRQVDAD